MRPAYGIHRAVITWRLLTGFENGKVYVFRALNNTTRNWKLLTETPIQGPTYFSDLDYAREDYVVDYQYRLLLIHNGKEYDSVTVQALDELNAHEYDFVRRAMDLEYEKMTRGRQGTKVLLFTPLREGIPVPGFDQTTGQQFSMQQPNDPSLDGFGERFVGGFNKPVETWIKFASIEAFVVEDMPEGESTSASFDVQVRMLAFPAPGRSDLIINPVTDNRYVVGEKIKPFYFAGKIPIAYMGSISLLTRSDARYRLPLP